MSRLARRRFLVLGTAAALAGAGATPDAPRLATTWRGFALGGPARLVLLDARPERARYVLERAASEVSRLEAVFSLHNPASELARLNRDGRIDHPSLDLIDVLAAARDAWTATAGAFDPTVQPVWDLLAAHFAAPSADPNGPGRRALDAALGRIGLDQVDIAPSRVAFARPGMALTLNGIAQGVIADRVAALLRDAGYVETLVDMGEIVAGPRSDGAWAVTGVRRLRVAGAAVATSAPSGTVFDRDGRFHHLIDPRDGTCPGTIDAVTVVAPSATLADALSTALAVAPRAGLGTFTRAFPGTEVHVAWRNGGTA